MGLRALVLGLRLLVVVRAKVRDRDRDRVRDRVRDKDRALG